MGELTKQLQEFQEISEYILQYDVDIVEETEAEEKEVLKPG